MTARDHKGADNIYAEENKLVVENDEHQSVVGSLAARDYKGVGNQYVQEGKLVVEPTLMRQREGKPGGGKGPLLSTNVSLTLAASNDQTPFVEDPVFFQMHQSGDTRIQDGVMHTLAGYMGTGGNNTPMVAIGIQGNVIGRQDHNGPAGKGHTEEGDPMFTLNTTDRHAVATPIGFSHTQGLSAQPSEQAFPTLRPEGSGMAVAFDEYNDTLGGDVHHALRAGTKQSTGVVEPTMTVRRLTPLECERLMGWPDNWTAGQSDTHRYKQCGNGVASPVAQWIGQQLINL